MTPYYQDANTELYCGDCLDIMADLSPVEMVLADPPYGTTSCKWDSIIPLEPMWDSIRYVLKKNGVVAMTASQPYSAALVMSNPKMFRHEWVWIKNRGSNFGNTVREPMKEHEVVLVFSEGNWTYNKQMQPRTGAGLDRTQYDCNFVTSSENYRKFEDRKGHKLPELRVPSSWQKFNTVCGKAKTKHSTQKPVALMEYLVKTYTNEGDTVLDFAMGSGTTGVACRNLSRTFIGIDNEERWCEVAKRRILTAGGAR